MTTILPTDRPIRYCITDLDEPIIGETCVGELTGVNPALTTIADADENAFIAALPAETFPALPDSGWLEADVIYQYEGGAVIVRQAHNRTEHNPADVPNLFIVWRADAGDALAWVTGEGVLVGTLRLYESETYRCIQAHATQVDYTPVATLGVLWELVAPPTAEWAAGVAYKGDNTLGAGNGDIVTYQGASYRCLQSHTSIVTWTPSVVPALWKAL